MHNHFRPVRPQAPSKRSLVRIMKLFRVGSVVGLALICQMAGVLSDSHASDTFYCKRSSHQEAEGKVIYYQTMTPTWLMEHASYIDSAHKKTNELLSFRAGIKADAALLKVPLIPSCILKDSAPLTVEITVANDISIGKSTDSDIRYGVSDGTSFVGFETCDKGNYKTHSPCYGFQGISGRTISSATKSALLPKPNDNFYPGQFVFTLKLDERWGSCYTAHDGGFTKETRYENRLMLSKGLNLEVYKENDNADRVAIKYIKVAIFRDD